MFYSHQIMGKFRPLQDWVILKPLVKKGAPRERGGILLPDKVEDYGRCEVVAIGAGRLPYHDGVYGSRVIPTELKVGEQVFIQRFVEGEFRFQLNGETVFAIRERHLNVTIEPEVDSRSKKGKKRA